MEMIEIGFVVVLVAGFITCVGFLTLKEWEE